MSEQTVNTEIASPETQVADLETIDQSAYERQAARIRRDVDRGAERLAEIEAEAATIRSERKARLSALKALSLLPEIKTDLLTEAEREEIEGKKSAPAGERVRNTLRLGDVFLEVLADGPQSLTDVVKLVQERGFMFGAGTKARSQYQRISSEAAKLRKTGKIRRAERGLYELGAEAPEAPPEAEPEVTGDDSAEQ